LVTPRCTPGVLDNPVSISVTNNEDTVVELGTTWAREDTASVGLEAHLVSLNGNGNWALSDSSSELILVVLWNILVRGDGNSVLGLLGLVALTVLSSVWVVRLGVKTAVGDDVLEGLIHETTVAALVAEGAGAVNELLLREGNEVASGNSVSTLNRASGGEGPA
jgi:hypothetical protein